MSNIYSTYTNPIDSLIFDPIAESLETKNDLTLWTNVQFTFDENPPVFDSSQTESQPDTNNSSNSSSPSTENITYEKILNYLNPELQTTQQTYIKNSTSPENLNSRPHPILPKLSLDDLTKVLLSPVPVSMVGVQKPVQPSKSSESKEKSLINDDKRKRNTAASARFRIKKKLKEQEMEKTIREMTEKSKALQNYVDDLEKEIKWLRDILTDKEKP
ncbi:hypothetical protein G6F46_002541 [Rhizopus delemar]|uniref:BZIP domain-containing protein n=3 Tax=Rhizopus TaxID=4842 RepID=I1BSH9_RHIO9|nr:hypothetical protein RO3G_03864 [Rhizopus delemar RA 99-880]KAG1055855.1 hypothetical protein G6F43_002217 [Rhizopus delemar]KAG1550258.1 hypothetical protein G6F51_002552 [Rhizopus arrhizus]KAG1464915.1 hypothetical protein G6F55_001475 [Rhizopus delemar]KAG1503754.1 hypothetical protein G6F54_001459 [Rhizopus delemar]|eukprot:EIE79159.1 hypothetical protein RO3G_03864 [Rhizopus delemar RA 99-880]